MKHLFPALLLAVATATNAAQETSSSGTRWNEVCDANRCVLQAKEEFASWISTNSYHKNQHKINLKLLCGREFGESSKWLSENKVTSGGSGADILVPFPPFKRMHCLYGAQPGHPMDWCHFGLYPIVEPEDLTIKGDYANEANILKDRIEKMFGITMIPLHTGKGFEYNDGYNKVRIELDSKTVQGTQTNIHPLVVHVYDLELCRQDSQMQDIYRNLKKKYERRKIEPVE